ncbi:unnamed protein product [Pleuronectes platessa]|uniref:Uncharacterized protein n=1 Tax=Pleuronectes platessa TaxID=8262 RepID=A0A9N7VUV2_PLEPL|nr:unnamed protein product [Pleuronectes platessa]
MKIGCYVGSDSPRNWASELALKAGKQAQDSKSGPLATNWSGRRERTKIDENPCEQLSMIPGKSNQESLPAEESGWRETDIRMLIRKRQSKDSDDKVTGETVGESHGVTCLILIRARIRAPQAHTYGDLRRASTREAESLKGEKEAFTVYVAPPRRAPLYRPCPLKVVAPELGQSTCPPYDTLATCPGRTPNSPPSHSMSTRSLRRTDRSYGPARPRHWCSNPGQRLGSLAPLSLSLAATPANSR